MRLFKRLSALLVYCTDMQAVGNCDGRASRGSILTTPEWRGVCVGYRIAFLVLLPLLRSPLQRRSRYAEIGDISVTNGPLLALLVRKQHGSRLTVLDREADWYVVGRVCLEAARQ